MKLAKVLTAAGLVIASTSAMAFTPPYTISGSNTFVGTATFKSGGSCKAPSKKFVNAKYGQIKDSTNASVGEGVIDEDGTRVLAVLNTQTPYYYTYVFEDKSAQKMQQRYMISFVGSPAWLESLNAAAGGCAPLLAWAAPSSYWEMKQDADPGGGGKITLSIKQSFTGLTDLEPKCVESAGNTKLTCKGNKFSGGFSFKSVTVIPPGP